MADAGGGFRSLPHRRAFSLALPAIASNVAVPLVGLIDTAVVGHFATTADLGAVGLGAAVVSSIFWAFAFLRPGTTSLVGRSLGAGNTEDATRHLQRALGLAIAMGAAWVALQWLVVPLVVRVLAGNAAAAPLAEQYALVRGLSLPAVLLTLAVVGYFIGAQDTRTPLVIAGTVAAVNAALAVWFVAGLGHGAVGSAWATFVAEWVGLVVALVVLSRRLGVDGRERLRRWRDPALRTGWGSLMAMNGNLVIRTALLMTAITIVASMGSRLGDTTLAANAILLQAMYLCSYALDGYATAAETMAAREIGAGRVRDFHRANVTSAVAATAVAGAFTVFYWWGGHWLIGMLTGFPDVTQETERYWWVAVALPALSYGGWMLDGIFLGVGRTRDMVASMSVSVMVFGGVLLTAVALGAFSNAILWLAFLGMNLTRAVTLGARYAHISRRRAWVAATPSSA